MPDRVDELSQRVRVIEREVEGEKRVTRHILEQTRLNSEDLAAIKAQLRRHDQRFDDAESKLRGIERKFDAFVKDFPALVAQTMRDVLDEREK